MPIHWVRIIESGHFRTQRLFELGLSFRICERRRRWPSLDTMNSFLKGGVDDGELGTTIEWDPCELSQADYIVAVSALMKGEPFEIDTRSLIWKDWMAEIEDEKGA